MRRVSTIVALALCTLLFASIISAQQTSTIAATTTASVPNLIRYSGTLKDAQGAALVSTAPVGVTFAIYNRQDGGTAVWQEMQNVTPEANGEYSVLLGSTTATGLPDDLFSQQEQRWLGVQVQGQEEQARVLLVSVPYAFKAHEADTLGGLPASAFIQVPPSGESPDTSAYLNALQTASGMGAPSSPPPPVFVSNGSCPPGTAPTPNYVPLWFKPAVNSNTICNSVIFQIPFGAAGNVGIGTIAPAAKLEVNGNINLTNASQGYQIGGNTILTTSSDFWSVSVGFLSGGGGGVRNTAVGFGSGETTGIGNVSIGYQSNQGGGGNNNVLVGAESGNLGVGGNNNTFLGFGAGGPATQSSNDIFIGYGTGNQGALMNDIYINAKCANCDLDHPENNTIRIGTLQTDAYMAGVYGSTIGTGAAIVCVDATGKLGTSFSSCTIPLQDQVKTQMEQVITQQQQQIESLQKQNAEFQQRLARLESLVATQ